MSEKIKDLNLLDIYLSSWEEDSTKFPGEKIWRAWKGYLFDTLDALENDNYIRQMRTGKSLILTKEGIERAKQLKDQYLHQ